MISSEFLDKLDLSYRNHLENALAKLSQNNPDGVRFVEKYMVPKELLHSISITWRKYQFAQIISNEGQYYKISSPLKPEVLNIYKFCLQYLKPQFLLSFPNYFLDTAFKKLQRESDLPLSKEVILSYKKMKTLYKKIKENENDDKKWMNALIEAEDDEIVEHNVEYRLSEDLTNKNLWKMYIEFWKERDTKKLLHTYSKYCRFWLDDSEMKEEYRKAAEKYGVIKVPWKNPFEFERHDKNKGKIKIWEKTLCRGIMHSRTCVFQQFAFRNNFIHYILTNSNAEVRQRLFLSCKYFYQRLPTPICYKLTIKPNYTIKSEPRKLFFKQCLELDNYSNTDIYYKNMIVSDVLIVDYYHYNKKFLKFIIPKLHRCDAKYLDITYQRLSFDDLKFLIGHGKVVFLSLRYVIVRDKSRKVVPIENIMKLIPLIKSIKIREPNITRNTAHILSKLSFKNKLQSFFFEHILDELEPHDFANYLIVIFVFFG